MADLFDNADLWEDARPARAVARPTQHQHVLTASPSSHHGAHLEQPLFSVVSEFDSWLPLDDKTGNTEPEERATAFRNPAAMPVARMSKSGAFIDQLVSHVAAAGGAFNKKQQFVEMDSYKSGRGSYDGRDRASGSMRGQPVPSFRPSMPGFAASTGSASGSVLDSMGASYCRTASSDCGLAMANARPARGARSNLAAAVAASAGRIISSGRHIQRGRVSLEGRQGREALSGEQTDLPSSDVPALPALRTSGNGSCRSTPLSKLAAGVIPEDRPSLGTRWRGRSVEVPDSIPVSSIPGYQRKVSSEMANVVAAQPQDDRPSVNRRWRGRSVEVPGTHSALDAMTSPDRATAGAGQFSPRPPGGHRSPSMPMMQAPKDSEFVHGDVSLWDPEIDALIHTVGLNEEPDGSSSYRRAKTQGTASLSSSKSRLGLSGYSGDQVRHSGYLPQVRSKASASSSRNAPGSGCMELGVPDSFLDSW